MHHAVYLSQRASPTTRARASSATRSKSRLHPYAQSSCLSPPHSSFSSVSLSPPLSNPLYALDRLPSQPSKILPVRDAHKSRYVIGLVDQAVKSLSEIWPSTHIPLVFLTTSRVNITPSKDSCSIKQELKRFHTRNAQLPSPISADSRSSPNSRSSPPIVNPPKSCATDQDPLGSLVPLKGFVHEVLRRSRTSGNVLQTALCYLEAIRPKVPELARQEQSGDSKEVQSRDRIVRVEDLSDAEAEALGVSVPLDSIINTDHCASEKQTDEGNIATVLCTDSSDDTMDVQDTGFCPPAHSRSELSSALDLPAKKHSKGLVAPLPPLPPLPSPLLCPRRAFLAALILASKFTQDRCYSNKAWAKLSGLPPREIGRCERALGDALDWRLWVGKVPTPSPPASRNGRAVVRSRSEGDLLPKAKAAGPSKKVMRLRRDADLFGHPRDLPGLCSGSIHDFANATTSCDSSAYIPTSKLRSLSITRRHATLPADAFSNEEFTVEPLPPLAFEAHVALEAVATTAEAILDQSRSPSPPTPALSFSPSSTESNSDGDRTIQMSTFIDIPPSPSMPPLAKGGPPVIYPQVSELSTYVDSYACGHSPADTIPGLYAPQLSYCGVTTSYSQDPADINNQLYTY